MDECFVTDSANKMLMSVFNKGDIDSEKTSELIDKSTSLNDGLPKNIITPVVLNGKQMYMITGNGIKKKLIDYFYLIVSCHLHNCCIFVFYLK